MDQPTHRKGDGTGPAPAPISGIDSADEPVVLSGEAFRSMFDYLQEAILCLDGVARITFVSSGIRQLLGYDPDSLVGRSAFELIHPEDLSDVAAGLERWGGRTGAPLGHHIRVRDAGDGWVNVCYDTQVGVDLGVLGSLIITLYEESARSDEVRQLRHQVLVEDRLARLAAVVLNTPTEGFDDALTHAMRELGSLDWVGRVSVWVVDDQLKNSLSRRATWAAPGAAPQRDLARSVSVESWPWLGRMMDGRELRVDRATASSQLDDGEHQMFSDLGLSSVLGVPLRLDDTSVGFLLLESVSGDIAHETVTTKAARAAATFLAGALRRNAAERKLAEQARTDRVTGLRNRWAFDEDLRSALVDVSDGRSPGFGLALVDLDRFKLINDTLGHAAGDQLLKKVADRLGGAADEETVLGRLGGDELLVLFDRCPTAGELGKRADLLLETLQAPFEVEGHAVVVTASVGLVHVDDSAVGPGELLRRADVAMYRAKALGGHALELDRPDARSDDSANLRREAELRDALRRRLLEVHYQGEWDIETGRLVGAEALVRWPHPTDGLLTAAQFVPLAEERGLVTELGWMVLREACRQALPWAQAMGPGNFILRVNVAADQLRHDGFVERVLTTLREVRFPAKSLCLELTESTLLADPNGSSALFARLRDEGVGLAIDDFGTGYSSMLQLKRLPLSSLKIDRSFVSGLPETPIDRAVVSAAVHLANALEVDVTAEGVETADQMSTLIDLGCTRAQGYLLSRPESPKVFNRRLASLLAS